MGARFCFNRVAGKEELYDREMEIKNLLKTLSSGKSVAVVAIKGTGKSSLVKSSTADLRPVVWIDLNGVYSSIDLAQHLVDGLAPISKPESVSELKLLKRKIETTTFTAKDFLDKYFSSLDRKTILVLDELTHVRSLGRLHNYLINIIYHSIKNNKLQVIIISSEIGAMYDILNNRQLPFGDILEIINLKPLDEPTSINFLYEGLEFYGAKCSEKSISGYYRISEGIPFWLTLAGVRMVEGLCNSNGIYNDERAIKFVLEQIAELSKKEIEMMRLISRRQQVRYAGTHLGRNISSLIRRGLVVYSQSGFMIADPLIEYMLKNEII